MRLMVMLSRVPYPLEKGDKLRAYHLVKRLARKHEIYLFCLSDGPTAKEHLEHLHQLLCPHRGGTHRTVADRPETVLRDILPASLPGGLLPPPQGTTTDRRGSEAVQAGPCPVSIGPHHRICPRGAHRAQDARLHGHPEQGNGATHRNGPHPARPPVPRRDTQTDPATRT